MMVLGKGEREIEGLSFQTILRLKLLLRVKSEAIAADYHDLSYILKR